MDRRATPELAERSKSEVEDQQELNTNYQRTLNLQHNLTPDDV